MMLPGASADFQTATAIATAMVKRFGMSEKVCFALFCNKVHNIHKKVFSPFIFE